LGFVASKIHKSKSSTGLQSFANGWGYIEASTPEKTMTELEKVLPEKHHVEINRLLVPFGKHICAGKLPKCSTCPVLEMCWQVGVTKHR
jgi:endonuclease-3